MITGIDENYFTKMIFDNNYIFKTALKLIDNKINYWVCHGTLLGIIRDNKLLSWDSDIDFAVWEDECPKKMYLNFFKWHRFKNNYRGNNGLHFIVIKESRY